MKLTFGMHFIRFPGLLSSYSAVEIDLHMAVDEPGQSFGFACSPPLFKHDWMEFSLTLKK